MSESDDAAANVELTPRGGRSLARGGAYERTQSVDRARKRSEPSPVFYLEPLDWLRSEGSSPLPLKEKATNKLRESFSGAAAKNLDILTESEENLNSEIEKINNNILVAVEDPTRGLADQRNHSLPKYEKLWTGYKMFIVHIVIQLPPPDTDDRADPRGLRHAGPGLLQHPLLPLHHARAAAD